MQNCIQKPWDYSVVLRPNPRPHFHQCGRVLDGWLPGYGCGHLWQHQRNPKLHIADDHRCPLCSKGPWYYELSLEEVESANATIEHPKSCQSCVDAVDNCVK